MPATGQGEAGDLPYPWSRNVGARRWAGRSRGPTISTVQECGCPLLAREKQGPTVPMVQECGCLPLAREKQGPTIPMVQECGCPPLAREKQRPTIPMVQEFGCLPLAREKRGPTVPTVQELSEERGTAGGPGPCFVQLDVERRHHMVLVQGPEQPSTKLGVVVGHAEDVPWGGQDP